MFAVCALLHLKKTHANYRIRQNSQVGKLLWFSRILLNRESFPVEYFTRLGIQEASTTKVFPSNFHFYSNHESFPPRMFCRIR